jgi:hypothetical protein
MNILLEIYNAIVDRLTAEGAKDAHRQAAEAVEYIVQLQADAVTK